MSVVPTRSSGFRCWQLLGATGVWLLGCLQGCASGPSNAAVSALGGSANLTPPSGGASSQPQSGAGGSTTGTATSSIANTGGAATGGVAASGGNSSAATGGSRATGGAPATSSGGIASTGGANATGGTTATGSVATGGAKASGGGTSATGGAKPSGGTTATGGTVSASGGAATGGAKPTGGTAATGGATSTPFSICTGKPASGRVVSIYVIGDSTASIYTSDLYPRTGWGQVLGDYFSATCAVVKDKALSGRSSKSFYDEGAWTPIRDGLVAGDFVIIQFGHNDEKSDDPTRYTVPQTTYKQYLTTYITDTQAKKAFPILATSINRNQWSGATLSDTHGAYPPAVRELAAALSVPLVDLTALTKTYFERIGQTETTKLFMDLAAGQFPNYPSGNTDNTHLQETGARIIARLFNSDAYRQKLPVASNLSAIPVAP